MLFDWNENGLETHGDLPFSATVLSRLSAAAVLSRLSAI
jgi:hypothetical protein